MTIRPCSHAQARQATERWHYTGVLPAAPIRRYGVWEDGRFVGAVVFGHGANRHLARPFGLRQDEVAELVRVALAPGRTHPTSAVVAACLRRLHTECPKLRLVVSYADTAQHHRGTIYQAGNWAYLGLARGSRPLRVNGRICHARSVFERFGTCSLSRLRALGVEATVVLPPPKHKYGWAFDGQMRRRLRRLTQPYPRAVEDSMASRLQAKQEGPVRSRADRSSSSSKTYPTKCGLTSAILPKHGCTRLGPSSRIDPEHRPAY